MMFPISSIADVAVGTGRYYVSPGNGIVAVNVRYIQA